MVCDGEKRKPGHTTMFHIIQCLKKQTVDLLSSHRFPTFEKFNSSAAPMACANGIIAVQSKHPLISFGVISDVQYADIPDGHSFLGVPRYYRHSLLVLRRAVQNWNSSSKNLSFVLNFGDIVDGFCPKNQSLTSVRRIVDEFDKFKGPTYHMIGNHCLYNLPREKLLPLLNIRTEDSLAYYDFSPAPTFRFVVLDAYDVSAIGWPAGHPKTVKALNFLRERNPNADKNCPDGLTGLDRRFLMFNGGVGKEQIEWLERVLKEASYMDQKVVICCHLPLYPRAASNEALLWNYDEVLEVVRRYDCFKACLAGHDHKGGYAVDSYGVHHRIFEAALECPSGTNALGRVDVFEDRLVVHGSDRMRSHEMVFR